MAAENTPGRITVRANGEANSYILMADDGRWLMAVLHNGEKLEEKQRANLQRLAACWNACEGVPMDWLASWANPEIREMFGSFDPLHIVLRKWMEKAMEHSQRAAAAVAQRDELLAARQVLGAERIRLEAERDELLAALVKLEASCSEGDIYSKEWRHNARLALIAARAAIAKHQPPAGKAPA